MKSIHRHIHRNNVAYVKKLASQIKRFVKTDPMTLVYNKWYTDNLLTPFQTANIVKNMKASKCQKLARCFYKKDFFNAYGNNFEEKFTMCVYIFHRGSLLSLNSLMSDYSKTIQAFYNTLQVK